MHFLEQYTWRLCWLKKIIVLRAYAPGPAMVVAKNFIMKKNGRQRSGCRRAYWLVSSECFKNLL